MHEPHPVTNLKTKRHEQQIKLNKSPSWHARAGLFAAIGRLARAIGDVITERDIAVLADPAPRRLPDLIIAREGGEGEQESQCYDRSFNEHGHLAPRHRFIIRRDRGQSAVTAPCLPVARGQEP
jgi:hypothetical protein